MICGVTYIPSDILKDKFDGLGIFLDTWVALGKVVVPS